MRLLARLDDRCHRINHFLLDHHLYWVYRFLARIERPLCDWVSLMDHVSPPRSRPGRRTRSTDHDDDA